MEHAIIISGSQKANALLTELLHAASIDNITIQTNAGNARRLLVNKQFDICIINAPLLDETGEELALDIIVQGCTEVLLLVKSEHYEEISHRMEQEGVMTLPKPFSKQLLWNTIKLANATHNRIIRIQKERSKLLQKMEDIRIIDRAKCLLISNFSMQEQEAHRYIEKTAMDMRMTKREVAEEVLRLYEE